MLDLERLRSRQEQRLIPALEAWNLAKKHLQEAIALTETREREFRELSDDVKRNLDALNMVARMAGELEGGTPAERRPAEQSLPPAAQPMLTAAAAPAPGPGMEVAEKTNPPAPLQSGAPAFQQLGMPVRRSWRPLFPSLRRSGNA